MPTSADLSPDDFAKLAETVRFGSRPPLCPQCCEREQGPDGMCRPCHVKGVADRYAREFAASGWKSRVA